MSNVAQTIGATSAKWDDMNPLRWTMSEVVGEEKRTELQSCTFDLATLTCRYDSGLLLAMKRVFIERRATAKLRTIETDYSRIRSVLQRCHEALSESCDEFSDQILFRCINKDFLSVLWAKKDNIPKNYLETFRSFFRKNRHNIEIFEIGLADSDFPLRGVSDDIRPIGKAGQLRESVLASALSRATLVHILNITEAAFESGELCLGLFAYSRLLLSRAARPETFRLIRLKDLRVEENGSAKNYYLTLSIPKSREAQNPRVTIRLHSEVGRVLDLQRAAVADRLAPLVLAKNSSGIDTSQEYTVGDLPLFPAGVRNGRIYEKAKERMGLVADATYFLSYYSKPLQDLTRVKMTHNGLRHTIGTQLAIAGCSTSTIAAVLLHATNRAASVYVDLVFSGSINELSDSLESAFLEHFPVFRDFSSIRDNIKPEQKIISISSDRLQRSTTGECGRREICHYAPITCYECNRFRPCYDADHSINLNRVLDELAAARDGGLSRLVDVKRYAHIANRIRIVISLCEAKRGSVADELLEKLKPL